MAYPQFTIEELESEEWRPVVGATGYEVSSLGRVRSYFKPGNRKPKQTTPTVMNPSPNTSGYPAVKMRVNGRSKKCPVHRLVLGAFVGSCPKGQEACHDDDNPLNMRLSNLRWDTRVGNHRDRMRHGTNGRKLTAAQVADIRAKWIPYRHSQSQLAREYGVSLGMINLIINNHYWKP